LIIGPDHYLYAVIGDLNHRGKLQNIIDGSNPDDTSVIFRVNPNDGSAAPDNPFINNPNIEMHKYYAYGIRNSFGITFDPITGNLWQTENGLMFMMRLTL
jgi:aldose sugar dehydrogenase